MKVVALVMIALTVTGNAWAMTWDELNELYMTQKERQTVYIDWEG